MKMQKLLKPEKCYFSVLCLWVEFHNDRLMGFAFCIDVAVHVQHLCMPVLTSLHFKWAWASSLNTQRPI